MKAHRIMWLALCSFSSAQALECDNAMTQLEMNQCASEAYAQANAALKQAYADVQHRSQAPQRLLLEKAQQHWLAYRDANCDFQNYNAQEGSVGPMVLALCLTAETQARASFLKQMLDCPEGDVSCPLLPK